MRGSASSLDSARRVNSRSLRDDGQGGTASRLDCGVVVTLQRSEAGYLNNVTGWNH
jgi:hypothetical protein